RAAAVSSRPNGSPRPVPSQGTPAAATPPRARSVFRHERIIDTPKHPWASSPVPGLPQSLAGLLTSLPSEGAGWTAERRQKFMAAFGTVLDLCFPIVEEGEVSEAGEKDTGGTSER